MQEENIKTLSFGCRLNTLETEKIQKMLSPVLKTAIIVNTCAVTAEAERQTGQAVRKIARENPNAPIFITGCAATRNPELFLNIRNVSVIDNINKMNLDAYINALKNFPLSQQSSKISKFSHTAPRLSKQFIQIQNGCNHKCAYCITRLLRGSAFSFEYENILMDARNAIKNGFKEIVLTGVDIASYAKNGLLISDLCQNLLHDVPEIKRLRLSSMDPASPEIFKIINMIQEDKRMMPHLHLSMQSGSNAILHAMHRRHNTDTVYKIFNAAKNQVTFSWDIICGFPGETDDLFKETLNVVKETKPIKIHAFPFSPRPNTEAANLPNQIKHEISKQRVRTISELSEEIRKQFMTEQISKEVQVLVEENNIARTPNDIAVKILGSPIPAKTICDVKLTGMNEDSFTGILL